MIGATYCVCVCVENAQVMVLAATYRPSELDEAILQHLPQAFEIGVPDQRERIEILKVVLKGERVEDNIDFGHIAGLCEGYTSLDLFDLCKKATYFPIIELLDEEKKGKRSHVSIFKSFSFIFFCLNFFIFLTTMLPTAELTRIPYQFQFLLTRKEQINRVCLFYIKPLYAPKVIFASFSHHVHFIQA